MLFGSYNAVELMDDCCKTHGIVEKCIQKFRRGRGRKEAI
jgi:hypothetical protein